ncbi:UDP-N-acetylmuramyl pentapeptide phosphotransferase/UDP-N-acetylglucosamine-1-phosphate transferase [Pseudomonas sp. GM50]|uniref:MraY family glycosyltransferase n=1 Tax=Pseudomonas sp. GM50 TaxID=1144332 RepID=UPI000270AFE2|nr:glycosyltransferase family 4 protein [Pseudomonas sp. GM50]EJM70713.1 UDP-N-acetylmuramyl pentapeptide phosphotransferase/UDP-N-acetylglucosamine-1-phosphate transferase [Pseudomonas sp. GM50]
MTVWWLLLAVLAVSWVLTLVLRRYALAKSLMDIPNERSSHSVPTPRGGGVAIVVAFLLALPVFTGLGLLSTAALYGLFGSGLLVAIIGFADDHGHIAARWRLLGHFIAAAWALFWLNGLPPIELFGITIDLGWFGNILALVYLVWMLNLYNFMDGIDGLASAEAISVCLGMCLVYWFSGNLELIWAPLILAAAVSGFLWWNFPPARIFMGDAGSGFLGIVLAFLSVQAVWAAPQLLWSWLILLGVFIVDATWTLIRRLLRGEKVYEAHRSHAYQYASRCYGSHQAVTLSVVTINILWLTPISITVGLRSLDGVSGVLLGVVPLIWLAYKFNAGEAEAGKRS